MAQEVRIYPLVTLDGRPSPYLQQVIERLQAELWHVEQQPVRYRFQKDAHSMLIMKAGVQF